MLLIKLLMFSLTLTLLLPAGGRAPNKAEVLCQAQAQGLAHTAYVASQKASTSQNIGSGPPVFGPEGGGGCGLPPSDRRRERSGAPPSGTGRKY